MTAANAHARTVLMEGRRQKGGGVWRQARPLRGRSPGRSAPPSCGGVGVGCPVCSSAFRDLLIYHMPADTDCLVCQGRRQEMSCVFLPRVGRNWE